MKVNMQEIMQSDVPKYKLSIEKLKEDSYKIGVVIDDNCIIYNESGEVPFTKFVHEFHDGNHVA